VNPGGWPPMGARRQKTSGRGIGCIARQVRPGKITGRAEHRSALNAEHLNDEESDLREPWQRNDGSGEY